MIVDFLKFPEGHIFEADLCIIGSGAAGISLAREFLHTHVSVVVLEGGGRKWEAETQKLYDSEVIGLQHKGIHEGRARMFGGTTTLWAGQHCRLMSWIFARAPGLPTAAGHSAASNWSHITGAQRKRSTSIGWITLRVDGGLRRYRCLTSIRRCYAVKCRSSARGPTSPPRTSASLRHHTT